MAYYDKISDDYVKIQTDRPLRRCILEPTFEKYLGDLTGVKAMDVGCGQGVYTRKLMELGAKEVVGNDVSAEMIKLAKKAELEKSLGIKYAFYDLAKLPKLGEFDLITARAVIHYAKTRDELEEMFQNIYNNLRPGGRLVSIVLNPAFDSRQPSAPYGYIQKEMPADLHDGSPVTITLLGHGRKVTFVNYHWSQKTYNEIIEKTGFSRIDWPPVICSPECDANVWAGYLKNPGLVPLLAVK